MVIKMHRLIRTFVFGALILLLAGCASPVKISGLLWADTGSKEIFMGPNVNMATLRQVLNDWNDIAKAICRYRPMSCMKESLTLDSIVTLGNLFGRQKEEYLTLAGLNDSNEDIKVLSIGTSQICISGPGVNDSSKDIRILAIGTSQICIIDPGSSGSAWITLYIDGMYQVIDETSLSE